MMAKMLIVGVAAIVGFILADWFAPKLQTWLKIAPDNAMGVKVIKYGSLGGFVMGVYWGAEKLLGKSA